MSSTVIVWFRRDLRLADNPALDQARRNHDHIVPVFVWDPEAEGDWAPGAAARWWLHHSLKHLDERLRQRDSQLILARGDTAGELARIRQVTGAEAVYWNRLYEPALVERDRQLKQALRADGVQAESCNGALLFEPWEIVKADRSPYLVFTPYWKQLQKCWRPPVLCSEPRQLTPPARWPATLELEALGLLPDRDWAEGFGRRWEPGELPARRRMTDFVDSAVTQYNDRRNRPDQRGTSRFSAHLHFGELSPRQVALALDHAGELPVGQGRLSLLREIVWREFAWYLLFHFPHLPDRPLKQQFEAFPWRPASAYQADLKAWQQGRTGIPMVDAGMRELWQTGWMHNRVRMIVASFLTKNLLIPWQEGARWFWDTLVDADLGNNTQGWQWTAGCGADAAPYFRVFNPVLQGEKFDPNGDYVRRWCPELAKRPAGRIHHPLEPGERCQDYPAPIVDLKESRQRALAAYGEIKKR
jgi:deoxyribodipyrimidine photo-lyase